MYKGLVSGAVLAGGRSSRMGKDKAGLCAGRKTFLEMQTEKLAGAGLGPVYVSCAAGSSFELPSGAVRIEDGAEGLGPLEGIRSVLSACETEYCLFLSVDSVLVKKETLMELADLAIEKKSPVTLLASARGPEPLTGVYSRVCLAEAERCLAMGKRTAKSLFEAFPPVLITLPEDDPQLMNCNTPDDYARVLALLSGKT